MPDDWDAKRRVFVTAAGRVRTRAELRAAIDKLGEYAKREGRRIASAYHSGSINEAEFVLQMRELLKSGHIVSAVVGRGGKARMTAKDWGRVGQKLAWQFKYLARFARQLPKMREDTATRRAATYFDPLHTTFYKALHEEFKDSGKDREPPTDENGKEILVRLEQNSAEGCEECAADAAEGWMPVDEMGALGSRQCGDWCKCDLIFSDQDPSYDGPGNQLE